MNRHARFVLILLGTTACEAPSRSENVSFASGDVRLAGTVVAPQVDGRSPGVVLVHGSGSDGRGNEYYWMVAEAFTRRGFAVLVYDKRGTDSSGGDWRRSSFTALIDDAAAAARALRGHRWVDSSRVGIWGGSEGGAIAPEVAVREYLDFVILQSAPIVTMAEQNLHQTELQARVATSDPDERLDAMHLQRLKHYFARTGRGWDEYQVAVAAAQGKSYVGFTGPVSRDNWWWSWYRTKMDYTPLKALPQLRAPVLAVWGGQDNLVPVERSRELFLVARRHVAHARDSVVVIPAAGHSLQISGLRGVFTRGLRNRPVHLSLMAKWAADQVSLSQN